MAAPSTEPLQLPQLTGHAPSCPRAFAHTLPLAAPFQPPLQAGPPRAPA